MRRHKAIGQLPFTASRWTDWATRLARRHVRLADVSRLALLLQTPSSARTSILLQQRRLAAYVTVQPKLNLAISIGGVWNAWSSSVHASRLTLLKSLSLTLAAPGIQGTGAIVRRADPPAMLFEKRQGTRSGVARETGLRTALTLAMKRTTTEHVLMTLKQNFSVRRQADFMEVSRSLTQRVRRLSDPEAFQPPMSFRSAASNPVSPQQTSAEASMERNSFERRSAQPTTHALAVPAVSVEQLADQVLKQIDRRVIARRERMGQI